MKKIKLNLGCGANIMPAKDGWINVDKFKLSDAKNFVEADIRNLPFASDYADYIILDQVLEHFAMADVPKVLFECKRVLKPGGRLVIVVPDFRDAANQFLAVDHDDRFNPYVYHYLAEVIYGNQHHEGEFHKTPMTAGYLNYTLQMVGLDGGKYIIYPAGGKIPQYDGIRYDDNMILRNAQLVADVTK